MKQVRESDLRVKFKDLPETVQGGCHARVWLPETRPTELDVVIMYHGGGWTTGEDWNVPSPEVEYLNEKGIVVVAQQYRLAPHARFKEIVQDITDGYEWVWAHLAQHVGAKSVRGVAVTGWSAGAHLACLVASETIRLALPRPKAVMVTYGLLDVNYPAYALPIPEPDEGLVSKALEGMCETGVPHQPPEIVTPRVAWLQKQLRDATLLPYLYGDPTHPLSLPKTYNPISLLTPSFPPTFVLIASADKLLDPQQSRNFRDRLQELEVVVSSAEIPMEHGLADFAPDNDEMERMYRPWFEQGIGPGLDWVVQRLRE